MTTAPTPLSASSPAAATNDPFAAPGGVWHPVSPQLVGVRRITSLLLLAVLPGMPVLAGVAAMVSDAPPWVLWTCGAASIMAALWPLWRLVRARAWVEAWGWCERGEDFCVRSGLWTRRLVVVPVGRLQVVKVASGPLLRSRGLARVQLVTATMETDANLPGLPGDVAAALRDRLIARSDAAGSGL